MKLSITLLLISCLRVSANTYSQKLSLTLKNASYSQAFSAIEQKTRFRILYSDDLLPENTVNVEARNEPLTNVLNHILYGSNLTYKVLENKVIVISRTDTKFQAKTISGTVTDTSGNPISGVSVMVKGTTKGTFTNAQGLYSIDVPDNNVTLVFAYVGYTVQEIAASGTVVNIKLVPLEGSAGRDVVVTALGIKKAERDLTYNVQTVQGSEVNKVRDASFVNSLSGKVAGVTINNTSGIGGSTRVVMRGAKSISGNNGALYVIDGVPLQPLYSAGQGSNGFGGTDYGDGISNINPDDIESMSILTGAAAAALYGGQAANGVVVINTKKGNAGKLKVNFSSGASAFNPFVKIGNEQNVYGSTVSDKGEKSFSSWNYEPMKTPSSYDPNDFFQTGNSFINSLNISTGTEKSQTFIGLSSLNSSGIIPNNKLSRYNVSFRNTSELIKDKLSLDVSANYISQQLRNPPYNGQYVNPLVPIYLFPREDTIAKYKDYERYDPIRNFPVQYWPYGDQNMQMQNPYWIVNRMLNNINRQRIIGTIRAQYNFTPWLNIAGRVNIDNTTDLQEIKYYASTAGLFTGGSDNGSYTRTTNSYKQIYSDLLLSLNKSFSDFNLNAILGTSITDYKFNPLTAGGGLGLVPNFFSLNNINQSQIGANETGKLHTQNQAIFATAELSYKQRIFLNVTGRNDWLSQLAYSTKNSTFYPSVGLSGVLSDIFHLPKFISYAKLRTSLSYVGNPPAPYITNPGYLATSGTVNAITVAPFSTLKPEKTQAYEAGLDLRLVNNKLNLSATYYNSNTTNQVFTVSAPPGVGYSAYYMNAGKVNNYGMEVSLGYNGNYGNFTWNPTVNFAFNRNKIKSVMDNAFDPIQKTYITLDTTQVYIAGNDAISGEQTTIAKGGSLNDIYQRVLLRDANGNLVLDNNGLPTASQKAQKVGHSNPDYTLGFNNSFTLKNFYLSFLLDARFGGQVVSATQAIMDGYGVSEATAQARKNGGVILNGQKIDPQTYYNNILGAATANVLGEYVYSATNIRLRELSFGYTFPAKSFNNRIQSLSIGITARNLWMIHNNAPFDPDVTMNTGTYLQGYDYFMQPSLRNIGLNVRISF